MSHPIPVSRRLALWGASCAFVISAMTVQAPAIAADDWPSQPVNFVVGFGVGGSADRVIRLLAQYLGEELKQPVVVVNRPGAGGQLAATYVLAQREEGYTMLASSISPYLANSIVHTNATYSLDDFAFVNAQWSDYDLIAVHKDQPFKTLPELLESIKANPGKHSVSVVPSSAGQITTHLLLEAAGIPIKNLNIVTYESGGQARSAVAGGQVDFTILAAEGSDGIRDMIRPIAIVRDQPLENWEEATPVNEALKPMGIEIPLLDGSIRGVATSAAFKQKYPERFDKLVAAYERTMKNEKFLKQLNSMQMGADWLGPEKTTEIMQRNFDIINKYRTLLN
ncbi:tripartite tricarboxylate transporter substrate-binding protein [Pollutimonas nitritireducens]|uniref:Tripartite tricarboxylate transporter substrate-binding protein n=1 Tax=Pollutimonas nitritireducens TaxID=2045209 RepID=A0A2N4UCB0_9BURK|nr:tripartite tricarboxylate transporter substrate binding protein [Pollutimonas nitritireducens]PLC52633.1 tripartite tricarboxylate transporter substrate-binding protein [Pollutimonas nitritireducens]